MRLVTPFFNPKLNVVVPVLFPVPSSLLWCRRVCVACAFLPLLHFCSLVLGLERRCGKRRQLSPERGPTPPPSTLSPPHPPSSPQKKNRTNEKTVFLIHLHLLKLFFKFLRTIFVLEKWFFIFLIHLNV